MKTAISIPDRLFEAAERLARRLGMSRSELYSKAVASYVDANLSQGVRERLDALYVAEPSGLDEDLEKMQFESLPEEKW
jgi:metal-responsive CopG/Arc/MetJ family transcriptional regulator